MKLKLLKLNLIIIGSLFLFGCAPQVAQVKDQVKDIAYITADIANVTKDRGESYKTAMLKPPLKIPGGIKKETSPTTYQIP